MTREWVPMVVLGLALLLGCRPATYQVGAARDNARLVAVPEKPIQSEGTGINGNAQLPAGLDNLRTLRAQLALMEKEMDDLRQALGAAKRGHFTSDETDQIERLLFRYLACRESLWEMVAWFGNSQENFAGAEAQTKAFTIAFSAAVLLDYHSSRLVAAIVDDAMVIRKLNEIHGRYDIPAGAYDKLFDMVTSRENIGALRDSQKFFAAEAGDPASLLARIAAAEPAYGELVREDQRLFDLAAKQTAYVLNKKSLLLPDAANLLRQTALLKQARERRTGIGKNLYVAQGILFQRISEVRQPGTSPADFTPDQVKLIKSLLRPGDLLFTFTAGYMSNVFLPGKFKHGITYIGAPTDRTALGLAAERAGDLPEAKRTKLAADLKIAKLESGYDADVIEAVGAGVIFNSIDYLLKYHINRLAVLRPRVTAEDRVGALLNTFLLLGGQYDYNFDFSDASYTCCTEAIYRSWNQRGGIEFKLVRRAAVQTLAADDIIQYHLDQKEPRFDVIILAEEDQKSKTHQAKMVTGAEAEERLRALMAE